MADVWFFCVKSFCAIRVSSVLPRASGDLHGKSPLPREMTAGILALMRSYPLAGINATDYPDDLFARTIANKLRIMIKHLRFLERDQSRLCFCLKNLKPPDGAILSSLVNAVKKTKDHNEPDVSAAIGATSSSSAIPTDAVGIPMIFKALSFTKKTSGTPASSNCIL